MTKAELKAKLAELHATLPAHVRDTVDLAQIKKRHRADARAATVVKGKRGGAKPAAKPSRRALSAEKGLKLYADNPALQIVNALLHALMDAANKTLPNAFRTVPVNLFGLATNRLDPLQFNGKATASASGEICTPRECLDLWLTKVCTPVICAGGGASAGLDRLSGLSSVRLSTIAVKDVPAPKNGIVTIDGTLELAFDVLSSTAFAEAHGGFAGINIPIGVHANAFITHLSAKAGVRFTIDLNKPKLTAIELRTFRVNPGMTWINISGLGPFGSMLGPLTAGLKAFVQLFFDVNGVISNALKGVLQTQLTNLVR